MTHLNGEETSQLNIYRNSTINTPHRQSKICFVFNTKFSKMTISHVYTSQFSQIFLLVWWRWHLFQSSFGLTDHTYRSTVKSLSSPGLFSQMDSYPIWVYRFRHLRVHHLLYAIWKVQNLQEKKVIKTGNSKHCHWFMLVTQYPFSNQIL